MLKPRKQGVIGKIADYLMIPVMYFLQGNLREAPQRTHRWNNLHLQGDEVNGFDADMTVSVEGDKNALSRWLGPIPLFHMVIFGGWKEFVVIKPHVPQKEWFVGWVVSDALGVSKIPLHGSVRLGLGPEPAQYFGVDADGRQIDIDIVGYGTIGKAGEFAKIPLL
ncbi:MAG: hypothetical protein RLZZ480_824 [Candidatus Parcubacteria bacterium]|jgi:hypothetical protein